MSRWHRFWRSVTIRPKPKSRPALEAEVRALKKALKRMAKHRRKYRVAHNRLWFALVRSQTENDTLRYDQTTLLQQLHAEQTAFPFHLTDEF